ncbi:hypothetical protein [Streptococcus sobrinus]|uniref:hypothetical protein n=1 Tax=Streptococcus sobrinus TaxID=1310 RepID=UPI0018A88646|nr:hypothetical protein [Streptococcus sobrinus]
MIDFYRGIDRDTDLVIPYLAELARKISPKRSANANYRSIEQLVEELGSREALNRSRPDDQALLEALEQAKRCFLNEDSKNSYDRRLGQAIAQAEAAKIKQEEKGQTEVQFPSLDDWDWEEEEEPVENSASSKIWLSWLLTAVLGWLLALTFLYFQWPLTVLAILLAIIVCLRLLLDD